MSLASGATATLRGISASRRRAAFAILTLACISALSLFVAVVIGAVPVTLRRVLEILMDAKPPEEFGGTNGAGKSTLLKPLSGEPRPTSGEISCCGEPLGQTPAWRLARRRAVMAQATQLVFPFTVEEVVRIGLETLGVNATVGAVDALVARALRRADIEHLARRKYNALSSGEQQRAHFGRVVCQLAAGRQSECRQALFLDAPVASLDIRHQLMLMDGAREMADSGVAVLAILS